MNKKLVKILAVGAAATLLDACAGQQACPSVDATPAAVPATAPVATSSETETSGPVAKTEAVVTQPTSSTNAQVETEVPVQNTVPQQQKTISQSSDSKQGIVSQSSAVQPVVPQSSSSVAKNNDPVPQSNSSIAQSSSSIATAPVTESSSSSVATTGTATTDSTTSADTSAENPSAEQQPIDPYQTLPAMVSDVFSYADTLFKQGNVDGAVAYLQKFRIMKPLWNEWQNRADSLLNVFGQTNAERAKQYEPLVLEIKNMNRVSAAYSLVAEAADSLIALVPGDSLVNFAKEQKEIAYKNTIGKALKEKTAILALAEGKALFDEALKKAGELKMRFRDFENELQTDKLIDYINRLQNSINDEDKKYWEKNDPAKALTEVDELIEKKSYAKAKVLVERLKASKLRQQAAEKYQKLADVVCTEKRKAASQLYSQATKQKKPEKKKELLLKAIGALNTCSDEYPEYEKIKTVTDNLIFLKKELDR